MDSNMMIILITCGTALFIDILLLIDSYTTFIGAVLEVKRVQRIIFASIIQMVIYLVDYSLYERGYYAQRSMGMLMNSMIFAGNLLLNLAFADFIFAKYARKKHSNIYYRLMFLLPTLAFIALALINARVPIFFDLVPGTLEYVETPWIFLISLLPLLYLLYAAIYDIWVWKRELRYNYLPVSLYFLPSLLGVILEYAYADLPIIPLLCFVSVMVMYIRVLKQIGYIDSLSGLYLRPHLSVYLNSLLHKKPEGSLIAGIKLDVNNVRQLNDDYGQAIGDAAIRKLGQMLKEISWKKGLCFRFGGDEFIIITLVSEPMETMERIRRIEWVLDAFNAQRLEGYVLEVSQGYAIYDPENDSVLSFVERMNRQMNDNRRALEEE